MPAPLPPQATPGSVLAGKYLLGEVIGRGGMGVVLAARHLTLGSQVAVKFLLAEADASARARFELEARAAALIASAHVAQVLDFGFTDDGLAYLVMEFLDGADLRAERRRVGRFDVPDAIDIVLEAAVGIAQAHAAGLVHRDIKPANIFLTRTGSRTVIKVLDFGLIKILDDGASLTNSTETFGTPKYMAPEQLRSARRVDERADQHALAAVLFELIAGRAPFDGENVPEVILLVCTEPAPLLWSIGIPVAQPIDDAIQRALSKLPDDRFPSLAEFADALAPFGSPRALELAAEIRDCLALGATRERVSGAAFADLRRTQLARPSSPSGNAAGVSASILTGPSDPTRSASASADTNGSMPTLSVAARPALFAVESQRDTGGTLSAGSLATARSPSVSAREHRRPLAPIAFAAFAATALLATAGYILSRPPREAPASLDTHAAEPQPVVTAPIPAVTSVAVPVSALPAVSAGMGESPSALASSGPSPSNVQKTVRPPATGAKSGGTTAAPPASLHGPPTATTAPRKCAGLDCL